MDLMKSTLKPTRLLLVFALMILLAGMILPQSAVFASEVPAPAENEELEGVYGTDVLTSQYRQLLKKFNREEKLVPPLEAGQLKLLNFYKTLYNKGNPNWDEMRSLYYDYRSAYYFAKSHKLEGKLILANHYGFSSSGKVTNRPMAKYTITQLRGTVLLLSARIDECQSILREGKRFMKQSKPKDN